MQKEVVVKEDIEKILGKRSDIQSTFLPGSAPSLSKAHEIQMV